jgi:hypothetical protein
LRQLERDPFGQDRVAQQPKKHRRAYHQLSLFPTSNEHPILDDIRLADLSSLTPDEARQMIERWQARLLDGID